MSFTYLRSSGRSECSAPRSGRQDIKRLPPRTVRYYVQIGLVDRPQGETRAARYGSTRLEQSLLIKKWTAAGVSLERIRELLHSGQPPVPPREILASVTGASLQVRALSYLCVSKTRRSFEIER